MAVEQRRFESSPAYFDPILDFYKRQIESHPIRSLCGAQNAPIEMLQAFAREQLVDGMAWVPMLARIKDASSTALMREAVRYNILDEVGCAKGGGSVAHITLLRRFVSSLGVPTRYSDYKTYAPEAVQPMAVMLGLAGQADDGLVAGWLLSQEVLLPVIFRIFRPAFERRFPGADLEFLRVHEEVDDDEHAELVRRALLDSPALEERAIAGMGMGARALIGVLDYLYSDHCETDHATVRKA